MPRQTREELDDEIIDSAAALFARHGFKDTSIQRIADAVGFSKTGLLHRFPSKEALQTEVVDRALAQMHEITAAVRDLPPGAERDRRVVDAFTGLVERSPGTVALLLSTVASVTPEHVPPHLEEIGEAIFAAFATDPEDDLTRTVRVVGALGALAVAAVACHDQPAGAVRPLLAALCFDALGHPRT